MGRKKDPLAPAYERSRKMLLKLLKAEGGVVELANRNTLRLIMKQNKVFVAGIVDKQFVPVWQFNDPVYPHIPKILRILKQKKVSDLMIMIFFLNRNSRLDNKTPLQALYENRVKDVMRAARCYLEHGAA